MRLTELSCVVARAVLYYSRSLKPVQAHKVAHIKDYLPKACPSAGSVILDAEILMVDKQGKMLPVRPSLGPVDRARLGAANNVLSGYGGAQFGTLGVHKKKGFAEATCCLIVFDMLYLNGNSLMDTPLEERRR